MHPLRYDSGRWLKDANVLGDELMPYRFVQRLGEKLVGVLDRAGGEAKLLVSGSGPTGRGLA